MESTKKGFGWGRFIVGALFIIAALLAFYDPAANLEAFAYAFAVMAIVYGIWLIITPGRSGLRIVAGIIDILIGIFLFFNIVWAMVALPYVCAVWCILDSLFRLLTVGITRVLGTGYYWFSVIVNILGVILGVVLLFEPITAALTFSFLVGFYLMLAGIELVVFAFTD